jgi:aminoglycoside phosphotransferase family enzyme
MQRLFNDLSGETTFLERLAGRRAGEIIRQATDWSDQFLRMNAGLIASRRSAGLFRDGHGDLHCRNIFLLDKPQIFDCIEFNDELRRIDVLNDIAFLCMDLDSYGPSTPRPLISACWTATGSPPAMWPPDMSQR